MKKILIAASAVALLLSATTSAYAGKMKGFTKDLQYGAGIGSISFTGYPDSFLVFYGIAEKKLKVKLGKDIKSTAQLRVGTGTDSTRTILGIDNTVGLDYIVSGLYKATIDMDDFALYGLGGFSYTSVTTKQTIPGLGTNSSSTTALDLTFGIGADFEIDKDLKLGVEYEVIDQLDILAANLYFKF